jgi:hypothetical protein
METKKHCARGLRSGWRDSVERLYAERMIGLMMRFIPSVSLLFFALILDPLSHAHQIKKESERISFEISPIKQPAANGLMGLFKKKTLEIEVIITNGTDREIYFERPVRFSNLHFVVIDESGKDIQITPDVLAPSIDEAYFVRIDPEGFYSETYDLLDPGGSNFRYRFKKGKSYNVYARYASGYEIESFKHLIKDKDATLFRGQLESNIRTFRWP